MVKGFAVSCSDAAARPHEPGGAAAAPVASE